MADAVCIGDVGFGGKNPLAVIAGPCVLEDAGLAIEIGQELKSISYRLGFPLVFKGSYDKGNRTRHAGFRGPGIEKGLAMLEKVRGATGLPVISDVHAEIEVDRAGDVLDCIQIPAFLCRQTDLLMAVGRKGKPVNLKKGQFLHPDDMKYGIEKIEAGAKEAGVEAGVILTERGSSFGYRYLVVDFQGMEVMKATGNPVVFDATHSVQQPGGAGGASSGDREMAAPLARAAAAVGVDGLFLEVYPDPDKAKCDGPNSVALDRLEDFLRPVLAIDREARKHN